MDLVTWVMSETKVTRYPLEQVWRLLRRLVCVQFGEDALFKQRKAKLITLLSARRTDSRVVSLVGLKSWSMGTSKTKYKDRFLSWQMLRSMRKSSTCRDDGCWWNHDGHCSHYRIRREASRGLRTRNHSWCCGVVVHCDWSHRDISCS